MRYGKYVSVTFSSGAILVLIIVTVNKNYDKLLAAADPENGASLRVLEKAGFVKAEYRKDYYERGALCGRKSDLQCFYLPRPSAS